MSLESRNVIVEIVPQRKYFIKGYSWNIYEESDKVRWDGYRGFHGWLWSTKATLRMVKFILKVSYFMFVPKEK